MSILKILFIFFLTYVIWQFINLLSRVYFFIKTVKVVSNQHFKQHAATTSQQASNGDSGTMVKCAKCQLYIPGVDAIIYQGNPYCCKEHLTN